MTQKMILIFAIMFVFFCGCAPIKDCGTDFECFKEYSRTCSRSRVNFVYEGSNIRVTTRGITTNACSVSFKIEEINEELKAKYPTETGVIKGKTLNCIIPNRYANYKDIDYFTEIVNVSNNFDKYCSGPVKDLMNGPLKDVISEEVGKTLGVGFSS